MLTMTSLIWPSMRGTILEVFLCSTYLFAVTMTSAVNDDVSSDVIRARCRVRCFSLLQARHRPADDDTSSRDALFDECRRQATCLACVMPCDVPARHCDVICSSTYGHGHSDCQDSCRFLQQVTSVRPGLCPVHTTRQVSSLCTRVCGSDIDCNDGEKCCAHGCSWFCVRTPTVPRGVPDIPEIQVVTELVDSDGVRLKWSCVSENVTAHVLYLIQSRSASHINIRMNRSDLFSDWQQVAETSLCSTSIDHLKATLSYQFRIMAVNIYGSHGLSNNTVDFALSREPSRPGVPVNLTEGDTVVENGRMSVTVHWSPASVIDLPVSRYKIFWSRKLPLTSPEVDTSQQEFRQVVPADHLSYRIPDLEPDTTYLIQVQAICYYGEARLKSDKARMYITTFAMQSQNDEADFVMSDTKQFLESAADTQDMVMAMDIPYFQNGLLRANVSWQNFNKALESDVPNFRIYWTPQTCATDKSRLGQGPGITMSASTQEYYFVIYDLLYDCQYIVTLESSSPEAQNKLVAHGALSTPQCSNVVVIGSVTPDCPRNLIRLPDAPQHLRHSFVITSSNITVKVTWDPPSSFDVTGYQVTWGRSGQQWQMERSTAVTRVLSKDVTTINIGGLLEATGYIVRIVATSGIGIGRSATARFTTPQLQALSNGQLPKSTTEMTMISVDVGVIDDQVSTDDDDDYMYDSVHGQGIRRQGVNNQVVQHYFSEKPQDSFVGTRYHSSISQNPTNERRSGELDVRKLDRRKPQDSWSADEFVPDSEYSVNYIPSHASKTTDCRFHILLVFMFLQHCLRLSMEHISCVHVFCKYLCCLVEQ